MLFGACLDIKGWCLQPHLQSPRVSVLWTRYIRLFLPRRYTDRSGELLRKLCENLQNRGLLRCCTTETDLRFGVLAPSSTMVLPLTAEREGGSLPPLPPLPLASSRGSSSWREVPGTKKKTQTKAKNRTSPHLLLFLVRKQ